MIEVDENKDAVDINDELGEIDKKIDEARIAKLKYNS